MPDAVIVDAVRSPMGRGKQGGALSGVHPVDLLAAVLTGLMDRTGLDPGTVDDVMVGCVGQVGEQSATPGRRAWLAAGFPVHVPSTTIDRQCGSSQQAVDFAAQGIVAGAYDIVIAGGRGVDEPGADGLRAHGRGPATARRRTRALSPSLVPQGVSAELVAARGASTATTLDEFAARSHQRAAATAAAAASTTRSSRSPRPTATVVAVDETIRPAPPSRGSAELKAVVRHRRDERSASREIDW